MASFVTRVMGAMRLDASTFEEVEHDRGATLQAAVVVLVAAVAPSLVPAPGSGLAVLPYTVITALLGWLIGAAALLFVGTKLLPGKNTEADMGQMLRTLGFAQAPRCLFGVFSAMPFVGLLVTIGIGVWVLVAMVIAVRQALDYENTSKAIVTCVVAWGLMFLVTLAAAMLGFGPAVFGGDLG
jgi:hypothetical protein